MAVVSVVLPPTHSGALVFARIRDAVTNTTPLPMCAEVPRSIIQFKMVFVWHPCASPWTPPNYLCVCNVLVASLSSLMEHAESRTVNRMCLVGTPVWSATVGSELNYQ